MTIEELLYIMDINVLSHTLQIFSVACGLSFGFANDFFSFKRILLKKKVFYFYPRRSLHMLHTLNLN